MLLVNCNWKIKVKKKKRKDVSNKLCRLGLCLCAPTVPPQAMHFHILQLYLLIRYIANQFSRIQMVISSSGHPFWLNSYSFWIRLVRLYPILLVPKLLGLGSREARETETHTSSERPNMIIFTPQVAVILFPKLFSVVEIEDANFSGRYTESQELSRSFWRSHKEQKSWEQVLGSLTPTSPLGTLDNTDTLHELNPKIVKDKLFPHIV